MTECFSARCQQDRKLVRREFNKWTKNLLLQIGLETISKNHFEFDVHLFNSPEGSLSSVEETNTTDFNPKPTCLFCVNRQEYISSRKSEQQHHHHHHHHQFHSTARSIDDDENAPLDLSIKSTTGSSVLNTSAHRSNVKHRPFFEIKSDIPPMYNQDDFDRLMSDIIAGQMDFSSHPYFNLNLFGNTPSALSPSPRKSTPISQETRIAQLAKQMAYERMMEEIGQPLHPKKSKTSLHPTPAPSSVLTESFHVNHLLNDVMIRILHEMFDKQQQQQITSTVSQPRASRKGELLFVKKQNVNHDEPFNHSNSNNGKKVAKHNNQVNPSSSSSSSTSSSSSSCSSSLHSKTKHKSKANPSGKYIPRGRGTVEIAVNNSKISIGMDGKQIRPKRGQYRRYESEQLAKAVAAVLSNEMSVHKAGSYFGVPHSTLEYKVKERNIKMSSTTKNKQESSLSMVDPENPAHAQRDENDDEITSTHHSSVLHPSNSSSSAVRRRRSGEMDNESASHSDDSAGSDEPMDSSPPIQFV